MGYVTFNPRLLPTKQTFFIKNGLNINLVPNLSIDNYNTIWLSLQNKNYTFRSYVFSSNLFYMTMEAYKFIPDKDFSKYAKDNPEFKSCLKKGDEIIKFSFNGLSYYTYRKKIKGSYLIEHLPKIGIDFSIDAPKTKRSEALNLLVEKNIITANGINMIPVHDHEIWEKMAQLCED